MYLEPKVLIVDEFALAPYDREAVTAFFTFVSARYERGSIILTSTKGFSEWGELLGDAVIAAAILDRLLHHSQALNIGARVIGFGRNAGPAYLRRCSQNRCSSIRPNRRRGSKLAGIDIRGRWRVPGVHFTSKPLLKSTSD